ncbi:hypothetical protein BGZ73_002895 [Actinomortierella ambigua]|nr:hypothetical protein BGZ73_002895 [Actinomortierella ambigua]
MAWVVTKVQPFEVCAIEAAKKDNWPNGTKAMDDKLKLAKMTKDMHDHVRKVATENNRSDLVTFGIRISGLNLVLYTMRQRPGRFCQLCTEASVSLPYLGTNDSDGSADVSTVTDEGDGVLGDNDDWQAVTMASPDFIPQDDESEFGKFLQQDPLDL